MMREFIAKNPDVARRVVKSLIEGIHLMRNNPSVAKRVLSKRMQIKDEKELEKTYQLLTPFSQSRIPLWTDSKPSLKTFLGACRPRNALTQEIMSTRGSSMNSTNPATSIPCTTNNDFCTRTGRKRCDRNNG